MDGKITISASTLDEAITKALIELQTTSEHLHYEVVQKESAGLLGIFGKKPCIIRAHVMSEAEEKAAAEAKKLEKRKLGKRKRQKRRKKPRRPERLLRQQKLLKKLRRQRRQKPQRKQRAQRQQLRQRRLRFLRSRLRSVRK